MGSSHGDQLILQRLQRDRIRHMIGRIVVAEVQIAAGVADELVVVVVVVPVSPFVLEQLMVSPLESGHVSPDLALPGIGRPDGSFEPEFVSVLLVVVVLVVVVLLLVVVPESPDGLGQSLAAGPISGPTRKRRSP